MIFPTVLFTLILCASCSSMGVHGQSTESFRIPNSGDSCNVVNLNFGRGEENVEQARGPQGPPGKRGSPGLPGFEGEKGSKGEVGPTGMTPEINVADITSAVMKALAATSCEELMKVHGINETGYYLMRSNETMHPVYTYCDFQVRPGVTTCQQMREQLGNEISSGQYLVQEDGNEDLRFIDCTRVSKNCKTVHRSDAKVVNTTGGVFDINPGSEDESVEVYCDLETDGGGWTVFQRRFDGSVDFYLNWNEYVNGFGKKDKEFWLGLETIHQLTKGGNYELRIDMTDWDGIKIYAKYGSFSVASRDDNYRLRVGDYSGTARDSLTERHHNRQFSTKDADHDEKEGNCASTSQGGWWYSSCYYSNLNGPYNKESRTGGQGIIWFHWKNKWEYLTFSEMKFREKE